MRWPAFRRIEDLAGVDPQFPVHGRHEILRCQNAFYCCVSLSIGGTNDLTARGSAARKQDAHRVGPVIASATRIDLRRSPEFAQCDDQGTLQHSAFIQIRDQGLGVLERVLAPKG